MQFALQALPFSRHAQNDTLYEILRAKPGVLADCVALPAPRCASVARLPLCPPSARGGVRILRNEGASLGGQGGRLLISGRMADVCAALNRLAFNEYACG
jgi:hypothetical protein